VPNDSGRKSRRRRKSAHVTGAGAITYELTKIDVAAAHIQAAVRLFFEGGHPVPIYTLASAARELLTTIGDKTGIETILHSLAKTRNIDVVVLAKQAHEFAGFFKHADRNPTATVTFSETEVDSVLVLACHDFGRVTGGMPVEAQIFEAWIYALAYPRVSDAPLKKQRLIKLCIREFRGIRSATCQEQKRLGLVVMNRALTDPSLQMEFKRVVEIPVSKSCN
jgi:hypothetical protein